MKIAIVGAGAVGSGLGAFLARAGHEVRLARRGAVNTPPESATLTVSGVLGEFSTHAERSDLKSALRDADLIVIAVKSYDTETAAQEVAAHAGAAPVLHVQNGLGNYETLCRHIAPERVLTGMAIIGFRREGPGSIQVTVFGGPLRIGRYGAPADKLCATIGDVLSKAGIPAQAADRVDAILFGKVLYNCALNPLGAILGASYGELMRAPARRIMETVIAEAYPLLDERAPLEWPDHAAYFDHFAGSLVPPTANHRSSMLMDLEAGRRTEIEALCGEIGRMARGSGRAAPVNEALADQIRFLESRSKTAQGGNP